MRLALFMPAQTYPNHPSFRFTIGKMMKAVVSKGIPGLLQKQQPGNRRYLPPGAAALMI